MTIVVLLSEPKDYSSAAEWIKTLDSFQIGEGAFLVREKDFKKLVDEIKLRLSPGGAQFTSRYRFPTDSYIGEAVPVTKYHTGLFGWIHKKG